MVLFLLDLLCIVALEGKRFRILSGPDVSSQMSVADLKLPRAGLASAANIPHRNTPLAISFARETVDVEQCTRNLVSDVEFIMRRQNSSAV